MIDLHIHSTASDGTDSPAEILRIASQASLRAIAITDHDTLGGYDEARPFAETAGVQLIGGIELSTRILEESDPSARSVHILGYFFDPPPAAFRDWLDSLRDRRRARNVAMAAKLQALGLDVTLEEAEALGRNITGRPHFARIMRSKGYVKSWEEAFRRYLGEHGAAYVEREDPTAAEDICRIREAGGIPSLAHPFRLGKRNPEEEESLIASLVTSGLAAIEVWHSDHDAACRARYLKLAEKYSLAITGGSDYHGGNKPEISLGAGRHGEVAVPLSVLDDLRLCAAHR